MKNKTNPKTVDLLTLTEAAALAGVSDGTMYRFVRSDKVPALPTASPRDKILIPRPNLVAHLNGLAAEALRRARAARKK